MFAYRNGHFGLSETFDDSNEITPDNEEPFQPDNVPYLHQLDFESHGIRRKNERFCAENGIKINTGKFWPHEDERIKRNFKKFREDYPDKDSDWLLGYSQKRNDQERKQFFRQSYFFQRLAHGLSDRPLPNIYWRARRILHSKTLPPLRYSKQETEQLKELYTKFGPDYIAISEYMDRCPVNISSRIKFMKRKGLIKPAAGVEISPKKSQKGSIFKSSEIIEDNWSDQESVKILNQESSQTGKKLNQESFQSRQNLYQQSSDSIDNGSTPFKLKSAMKRALRESESGQLKIRKLKKSIAKELNLIDDSDEKRKLFAQIDEKLAKKCTVFVVNGKFVRLNCAKNNSTSKN